MIVECLEKRIESAFKQKETWTNADLGTFARDFRLSKKEAKQIYRLLRKISIKPLKNNL